MFEILGWSALALIVVVFVTSPWWGPLLESYYGTEDDLDEKYERGNDA